MEVFDIIKKRILIFDGAMGTEISRFNKSLEDLPNDFLNIKEPEFIEKIHRSYIESGADVIETNTFNSNPIVLEKFSKENYVEELNKKAVEIAKSAVSGYKRKIFICGSIGPLDISLSLGSKYSFDDVKNSYIKQIEVLFKSGVDFVIFETAHDLINLKAGVCGVYEIFGNRELPVIVSVTLDSNGLMLSGHDIKAVYSNLSHFKLIALGINCSTGPIEMQNSIKNLSEFSHFPTIIMPNAGFPGENGRYNLSPEVFANTIKSYSLSGYINIAGGCCGTNPNHIKLLSEYLDGVKPREVSQKKKFCVSHKIPFFEDDIEKPFLCAERLNTLGSKKFKDMVINSDTNGIISLAKEQANKGAHLLDISFINPERNEIDDIKKYLPIISSSIRIPFMIDSTNINSFELASKLTGARIVINSVNFENGDEKVVKAIELAKKYGFVIVCGLIDESKTMPFEFERKMKVFQRAKNFFIKNKFLLDDVLFDPLVFPIASVSYNKSAYDTLLAVEEISKQGFRTILGISNISFGLKPTSRKYLNSIFLYHAIRRGLDFAIVNILEKIPYSLIDLEIRDIAEKILLEGRIDLIKVFSEKTSQKINYTQESKLPLSKNEILRDYIINGNGDVEKIVDELLKEYQPLDIINKIIIPSMNKVGEMFRRGEYIVTEVLASASISQRAIDRVKPFIKKESFKKGKLLIATVKGDVHDIGKNLVSIIFESNGYDVIDLGTKVEPETIVEKVILNKPDFIGLSGLLARSCDYMIETAKKLREKNITAPLIVGGAAVSKSFVEMKLKPIYKNSFYASDAIEGVRIANEIKVV